MSDNIPRDEPPDSPVQNLRTVDADEILQGDREVLIDFHGTIYKLRVTRQHKLILHKP